ncbi:cupin domain-containing protein [Pararobbsia silviterrae]|uniref:Cupin domain-containing protein n=1 Tax=Pararobbsia silviterrae TaxID=1792498 RepID=A0A494Y1C7_9BURK|nr:cupin domain-containing protein [Pararobbsia silviterrae]RKP56575.1 cupin domain-containing protein [Pararobbsia silviterrae]
MMHPDFDSARDLPQLHQMLDAIGVKNGWNKPTPSLYPQPKQPFAAAHWDYASARAALDAAGRLVGTEWAERRNLILANPTPGNEYPTVTTLVAAYQMVKGGESARSHRHTPNAMRVVMEAGPQAYTIVDGVNVPMARGDVLLTPNWAYHGHDNRSAEDAYWIDILDAPLVQMLGPMFFEPHPDHIERASTVDPASPMRFAFEVYAPALLAKPESAPGVRQLSLGPATLDTFDRTAIALSAHGRWHIPRHTSNEIFVVVEGAGRSTIGDASFAWGPGDVLAAPSWLAQTHKAERDAILIRMSDAPVMRAFHWLRSA